MDYEWNSISYLFKMLPDPIIQTILLKGSETDVLRLDMLHPEYGGNKFFKLKYNVKKAFEERRDIILTYGGAHSNHLLSTAAFCKEIGIKSAGVIRGEERYSPTLKRAAELGMRLKFVSREEYNKRESAESKEKLILEFGNIYFVPEGGNNREGVHGCSEILSLVQKKYDYVFCACGTAATFSGIYISAPDDCIVTGISVLKGENTLIKEANRWIEGSGKKIIFLDPECNLSGSTIINNYHFGGYARFSVELIRFKKNFEDEHPIALDHVYTSKLFYAVSDLLVKEKIQRNKKILIIHSGGLQGNEGFEKRFLIS